MKKLLVLATMGIVAGPMTAMATDYSTVTGYEGNLWVQSYTATFGDQSAVLNSVNAYGSIQTPTGVVDYNNAWITAAEGPDTQIVGGETLLNFGFEGWSW